MTLFVYLPTELFTKDLTDFWSILLPSVEQAYPSTTITSNYTGVGTVETSDAVLFLYDYRKSDSVQAQIERCKALNIPYNFFKDMYKPIEEYTWPDDTHWMYDL